MEAFANKSREYDKRDKHGPNPAAGPSSVGTRSRPAEFRLALDRRVLETGQAAMLAQQAFELRQGVRERTQMWVLQAKSTKDALRWRIDAGSFDVRELSRRLDESDARAQALHAQLLEAERDHEQLEFDLFERAAELDAARGATAVKGAQ